jgi:hypothetical protein
MGDRMSLWQKMKTLAKEHIEENKKINEEIAQMTDKELKAKAVRQGGKYADAYVKRKTAEKELKERIKKGV